MNLKSLLRLAAVALAAAVSPHAQAQEAHFTFTGNIVSVSSNASLLFGGAATPGASFTADYFINTSTPNTGGDPTIVDFLSGSPTDGATVTVGGHSLTMQGGTTELYEQNDPGADQSELLVQTLGNFQGYKNGDTYVELDGVYGGVSNLGFSPRVDPNALLDASFFFEATPLSGGNPVLLLGTVNAVPEPAPYQMAMVMGGLGVLLGARRRLAKRRR